MNPKKITATLLLLAISLSSNLEAKSNKEYFNTLEKQRVESSNIVEWKNIGPGMSGYNETFICHPTDPNVMFMGPDMRVSYGTWDGGKSWQTIKDSDGTGRDLEWLQDIEFSVKNPDHGVAITFLTWPVASEVYETFDRGRSWSYVGKVGKVHRELAICPEDDKVWYVGAGDFWNIKYNHRSAKQPHGVKSKNADYGHVMRTRDGGKTWSKIATEISPDLDVAKIIVNPTNAKQVVMASNFGVYRSNDGGDSWSASGNGLPNNLPRDMTSFYDNKSRKVTLYLVEQTTYEPAGKSIKSNGGVFRSDDFGGSWVNVTGDLGLDMTKIHDLNNLSDYRSSMAFWLGEPAKTFATKYPEQPKNILPAWNRIVVDPNDPNIIYVAHNKRHDRSFGLGDVWKSSNGGKTWSPVARCGAYWHSGKDAEYWLTKGVKSSMNQTFSHVAREMYEKPEHYFGCRHMAINPKGELFIGVAQQTLKSDNGGDSWMQIDDIELKPNSNQWIGRGDSNLPGRFIQFNTGVKGQMLFCSGEHGLFKNVDLGDYPDKDAVAFQQIEGQVNPTGAHSVSTVAVHPNDPNTIYILMWRQKHRGTLRRSTDGGKTWENISTIFESASSEHMGLAQQASLLIDPSEPKNLYFCSIRKPVQDTGVQVNAKMTVGDFGVYRSTDSGYNWELSNSGLPENCSVNRLTMDPKNPKIIYASLTKSGPKDADGGLYRSTDGAKTWRKVSIPFGITSVNDTFINKRSGELYISCGSKSGANEAGGVWRSANSGKSWDKIFYAPNVWHTEVSEANSNIVMVTSAGNSQNNRPSLNPGVYISLDNAQSWNKINRGLGQPDKIVEIKPDPWDESVVWCTSWGCGWFKGRIK